MMQIARPHCLADRQSHAALISAGYPMTDPMWSTELSTKNFSAAGIIGSSFESLSHVVPVHASR
jgi:hypothetical protein